MYLIKSELHFLSEVKFSENQISLIKDCPEHHNISSRHAYILRGHAEVLEDVGYGLHPSLLVNAVPHLTSGGDMTPVMSDHDIFLPLFHALLLPGSIPPQ